MADYDIIIEPQKSITNVGTEIWKYRDLFYFLAWRDILVRYKQTVIGILWSLLRPLLTMIVFTIIFGLIAKLPSENIPYPLFVFAAMIPWQFFSNTFSEASNSLIYNTQLISKVYFPRIIIPTTAMVVSCVDFGISFALYLFMMVWYGIYPGIKVIFLPLLLLHAILASLGSGYIIAALNVKYRDFLPRKSSKRPVARK